MLCCFLEKSFGLGNPSGKPFFTIVIKLAKINFENYKFLVLMRRNLIFKIFHELRKDIKNCYISFRMYMIYFVVLHPLDNWLAIART
jgi:hypothetical protein